MKAPKNKEITVVEAVTNYIESSSLRLKPATIGSYRRHLKCHIAPYFDDTQCNTLTAEIAQGFVNKLIKENGLSVNTVQSVFNLLKVAVYPMISEPLNVKFPKRAKCFVDFLTVDEQRRIEQAARKRNDNDYIAVMLCLYTGIRIGEACGLRWADICFERRLLQVKRTMQRIDSNGETKTEIAFILPKSDTSERIIPLPDFLFDILCEFKANSDTESILSYKNKHIEPRTLQNRFKKILESAGVRDINFIGRSAFRHRNHSKINSISPEGGG